MSPNSRRYVINSPITTTLLLVPQGRPDQPIKVWWKRLLTLSIQISMLLFAKKNRAAWKSLTALSASGWIFSTSNPTKGTVKAAGIYLYVRSNRYLNYFQKHLTWSKNSRNLPSSRTTIYNYLITSIII